MLFVEVQYIIKTTLSERILARLYVECLPFSPDNSLLHSIIKMQSITPTVNSKTCSPNIAPREDGAEQDVIILVPTDTDVISAIEDTPRSRAGRTTTIHPAASYASESSSVTGSSEIQPVGYDRLSKLIASDNDFLVFRRFGELNVRNILYLQDQLSEITEELAVEDAKLDTKPGTRRWDDNRTRNDLMQKAEGILRRYSTSHQSEGFSQY